MSKYFLYCFLLLPIFPITALSQTFSSQKLISSDLVMAHRCFSADLDNDGDQDVISLSSSKIAWYENTDGHVSFGNENILSDLIEGGGDLYAGVLEANGYADIIWVSPFHLAALRLRNVDGNGIFNELDTIALGPPLPDHPNSIYVADIDGDGDSDVIVGDFSIYWFENISEINSFSSAKTIATQEQAKSAFCVYATDLDNDGDIDVLSASLDDHNMIAWYKNIDGASTFEQQVIATQVAGAQFVFAADIDNDGDMDVLSASADDGKVAWYENLDGNESFSGQKIISQSLSGAGSVLAADIDNDNDLDVIACSPSAVKIVWYENINGQGEFSQPKIIDSPQYGPTSIHVADLDVDGDIDILATITPNKIVWYENLTNPTSVQENQSELPEAFQLYQNYPNPFNPSTTISYSLPQAGMVKLEIYNLLGQKLETLVNEYQATGEHQLRWQSGVLPSGIYFYKFQAGKYSETKKLILQK